jgi:hypothetical protein
MSDQQGDVVIMAALAAVGGGLGRILMVLHGGERKPLALAIEAGLGALLGIMTASAAVYLDADMQGPGWPYLIVGGAAGCAGAIGTRMLDIVTDAVKKRIG